MANPEDGDTQTRGRASRRRRPRLQPQARFDPRDLDRTVLALPLLREMERSSSRTAHHVIVDVNLEYPDGREQARRILEERIRELTRRKKDEGLDDNKNKYSQQYLFARLRTATILKLIRLDREARDHVDADERKRRALALYRIWLDHEIERFCNVSLSTVKADAARNAFGALGKGIVWAVIDSGIDGAHPHFGKHGNLKLLMPLRHNDFTQLGVGDDETRENAALTDEDGHGTHVAGIIAGEFEASATDLKPEERDAVIRATYRARYDDGEAKPEVRDDLPRISGMSPQCKLLSLKALSKGGRGRASNLLAAIEYIQQLNGYGRRLLVHGVNLSVGYDFEPKWFACGQSPLCVEVDRLVRSGVVVVVAAGNTGYGYNQVEGGGPNAAGLDVTINDPGNSELAITVGSTHREMPHVYGVSFFSSKGPTGDGRLKPDLVAPGEKIISCDADTRPEPAKQGQTIACYREESGTSMAAPHVSGIIASFLSIRREFIGRPERVKEVFMDTATDLRRAVYFQGKGLVDLMRAIQSV